MESSDIKIGDKITISGIRFGKYPNGRTFTTRCRKGNETVLTVSTTETEIIKPPILEA